MENSVCRYPNSVTLFKFCKRALNIKYNYGVKVIDQDVGGILKYDPADCCYWKKGKKIMISLHNLKLLADYLDVDLDFIIEIAKGNVGYDEAIFEFLGYGKFSFIEKELSELKRNFLKEPGKFIKDVKNKYSFDQLFNIDVEKIEQVCNKILSSSKSNTSPVKIEDIYSLFSKANLLRDPLIKGVYEIEHDDNSFSFKYKESVEIPYIRFIAIKSLYDFLIRSNNKFVKDLKHYPDIVQDILGNIFASVLLMPSNLIKKEISNFDNSKNIVNRLSSAFLLSPAVVNKRINDLITI